MRIFLDITCPRCGALSSFQGLSREEIREIGKKHVCADGSSWHQETEPVQRIVPGPGEHLKDKEEEL